MDIKKEIESYIDTCNEYEEKCVSNKHYGDALYTQGMNYAYGKVLQLLEEHEKEKAFSWGNVKLGDEVARSDNVCGKVVGLIYTEKGFSGIRVCYEKYGSCCGTYQGDDYKLFKQIGDWVNGDWVNKEQDKE